MGAPTLAKLRGFARLPSDHCSNRRCASTPNGCGEGTVTACEEPSANHSVHGAVHGFPSILSTSPGGTVPKTCRNSRAVSAVNRPGPWMFGSERGLLVLASSHATKTRRVVASRRTVGTSTVCDVPWFHQGETQGAVHALPSTTRLPPVGV